MQLWSDALAKCYFYYKLFFKNFNLVLYYIEELIRDNSWVLKIAPMIKITILNGKYLLEFKCSFNRSTCGFCANDNMRRFWVSSILCMLW